jgi:SAM-dependent methyltransferase
VESFYNKDYYESGPQSGKSLYQNFRWIPELTIPLAHHLLLHLKDSSDATYLDFGCAKGFLVHALRLLGANAFGVDISEYAISQCKKETTAHLKVIKPFEQIDLFDHVICKDILEHIPYDSIDKQLKIISNGTAKSCLSIIPLGKDGRYIIPAYELDKSHFIRESQDWWVRKFQNSGFTNVQATSELGPFKTNWQNVNNQGNTLIIAKK